MIFFPKHFLLYLDFYFFNFSGFFFFWYFLEDAFIAQKQFERFKKKKPPIIECLFFFLQSFNYLVLFQNTSDIFEKRYNDNDNEYTFV